MRNIGESFAVLLSIDVLFRKVWLRDWLKAGYSLIILAAKFDSIASNSSEC